MNAYIIHRGHKVDGCALLRMLNAAPLIQLKGRSLVVKTWTNEQRYSACVPGEFENRAFGIPYNDFNGHF